MCRSGTTTSVRQQWCDWGDHEHSEFRPTLAEESAREIILLIFIRVTETGLLSPSPRDQWGQTRLDQWGQTGPMGSDSIWVFVRRASWRPGTVRLPRTHSSRVRPSISIFIRCPITGATRRWSAIPSRCALGRSPRCSPSWRRTPTGRILLLERRLA